MSLTKEQRTELNMLADTIQDKMESTANEVLDKREVDAKKNRFSSNSTTSMYNTLKKEIV
jgi:hypothetical protein